MANLTMTNWYIKDKTPYIVIGTAGENNATSITIQCDEIIENADYFLDIGDTQNDIFNTQELTITQQTTPTGEVINILSLQPMRSFLGKEGVKLLQVRCEYMDDDKKITKESNVIHAVVNKNSGFIYKFDIAVFQQYFNQIKALANKVSQMVSNITLDKLQDTNIVSPTNGQVIKYNAEIQQWVNGESGGSSGGSNNQKAIVVGDSYFDNSTVGYNFADYLRAQGIYDEVFDYGMAGSGFGHVKMNLPTLLERLQNPQMRADVAESDVMYLHLGGNDMLANINEAQEIETSVGDITLNALQEINEINPNITIYFIPWRTIPQLIDEVWINASLGVTNPFLGSLLTTRDALYMISALNMILLAIAAIPNVMQLTLTSGDLINEYRQNDVHPTVEAAQKMFHGIVYGEYEKPIIRDIMYDFTGITETGRSQDTLYPYIFPSLKANMRSANYSLDVYYFNLFNNRHVLYRQNSTIISNSHVLKLNVDDDLETLSIGDYGIAGLPPSGHPIEKSYNLAKLNVIPDTPTTDGNYGLGVIVSNGVPTYQWIRL